jgi:hypothetical protein
MTRRLRLSLWLFGCPLVLAAFVLLGLYLAARHEPAFYRAAMATPRPALEKGSDRTLRKAAALQSALARPGRWEIRITAEEINGWLAVDLPKNHPKALPPDLADPRVAIDPNQITLACRYKHSGIDSVLSLAVQPYVSEPNAVALRIVGLRAGAVPLPLERVIDGLSQAARDMRFRLEWRRSGADPVAMLSLPAEDDDGQVVRIDTVRLGEGEIYIAGTTQRRRR